MSNNQQHDRALEYIVSHYFDFGIKQPTFIARNVRLYEGLKLITETDVVAYEPGKITLIEYKASYRIIAAQEQLDLAARLIKHGDYPSLRKVFVYGEKYTQVVLE